MHELVTLGNQLLALGFGKEYTRGALFVLLHLKRKTAKLIQCTDRPTKRDKGDVIGVIVNTPTLE